MSAPHIASQRVARIVHGPKGSMEMDGASYRRHGGVHILNLSGGPYDRAFQHGSLLRQVIPEGPLPLFNRYMSLFLELSRARAASPLILEWLSRRVVPRIQRQYSPRLRAAIAGMADGAGLPEAEVSAAYALPEAMLATMAMYGRVARRPIALPPLYGCTSAVAGPERTRRNQLLHGRNFDFFGMDRWSAHPVVAFHTPEEGLRHVSVTSAGIVSGGITAMNEQGVVCTVHQHFPKRLDFDGLSVGEPAEEVARLASSVEEAISLLDQQRTIGSWTFILSDPTQAVAYEMTPAGRRVVPMEDGVLGYANVLLHPDLSEVELDFHTPYVRANHARQARVTARLAGEAKHDEEGVISILADRVDPAVGQPVAFGTSIASVMCAASVVFRPADGRLWVSSGAAPACYGPFVGFDLKQAGPSGKPKRFEGPLPSKDPVVQAIRTYVEGVSAAVTLGDEAEALAKVEAAIALQPDAVMYRLVAATMSLRADRGEGAEAHLRHALGQQPSVAQRPDVAARIQLNLAWALDLQGRRGEAKQAYREALNLEARDPDVRGLAKKGLRFALSRRQARHLPLEFVYG